MNLHNGSLYWPTTTKPFTPKFIEPLDIYDVVIVGGGMSGSLTALTLAESGLKVAVLDKRMMGTGSTSANTGLLQYSNDIMLHELIGQIGEKDAVRFYQLCYEAMDHLELVSKSLDEDPDFIRRPSLCFASEENDVEKLKAEYITLQKYNFPCDYLGRNEIANKFSFSKDGALLTLGDAEVNPLKFVQGVLRKAEELGVHLYPYTEVINVIDRDDDMEIRTTGKPFYAKKVVYTTGYEDVPVGRRDGADINHSYVFVSNPIRNLSGWHEKALIWETKRPYLYARTCKEGRLIIGGMDKDQPEAPQSEELMMKRVENLLNQAKELFPQYDISVDYAYAATFGESTDNLPFIGQHPTKENHYYLLGYGGNGTVYSMLGSHILRDLITGHKNEDAEIVHLDRLIKAKKRLINN